MLCARIGKCADVYPLRAEKCGLHQDLTCVYGDRGCKNPNPGDVAETRGFAISVPKAKKSLKGLTRATHCTDRAQTSGNVSPAVELCPPYHTFGTKVRARRDVPKRKKKITIIHVHIYILEVYSSSGTKFTEGRSLNCRNGVPLYTAPVHIIRPHTHHTPVGTAEYAYISVSLQRSLRNHRGKPPCI